MDRQQEARCARLSKWLLRMGIEGATQGELLSGYCDRLTDLGVSLFRVHVAQRAHHPRYGGIGFSWMRGAAVTQDRYEREVEPNENWRNSPLYHLLESGAPEIRVRLAVEPGASRFPLLNELKTTGVTDYFATPLLFEKLDPSVLIDPNDPPEGALISWCSDGANGFTTADMDLIRGTLEPLGLALKSAANRRMAEELLRVYLGADAGRRVLSGEIGRGTLQAIDAVICYFDLAGFTQLAERTPGAQLIAMLNDYFGMVASEIEVRGGNVLKFMGDGLLAIFDLEEHPEARSLAIDTAIALRRGIRARNVRRERDGLPVTGFSLALHSGEVLYGNIGAEERLDFTVIGPAVNLTARLAGMHRNLGQSIILSERVAGRAERRRGDVISLGRYMLRGVADPLELFTIHSAEARDPGT